MSRVAICTLFEGDYHHGLGALINSLCAFGYKGKFFVGFRGALPPWFQGSERLDEMRVEEIIVRFIRLETGMHFAQYKPSFLLDIAHGVANGADAIVYFDPDLTLKCRWSFFESWAQNGIALCEDVNSPIYSSHPHRYEWKDFASKCELSIKRDWDIYVNSGFLSVKRADIKFLRTWEHLIAQIVKQFPITGIKFKKMPVTFNAPDQDALNIALMCCDIPISLMGQEGMDFKPGGYTMAHAVGENKPWRKNFLREAITGRPPSSADKGFIAFADGPIHIYSTPRFILKRLNLMLGSALGRFISRR